MRIIRFVDPEGAIAFGSLQSDGSTLRMQGDIFGQFEETRQKAEVARLLAPLVPTQIIGVGLNYRQHAQESGMQVPENPVMFMKALNTLQHPGAPILIPTHLPSHEVDYECELAVVIGRACRNATRQNALDFVLGYTCANDVSARDWQIKKGGGQWTRGKSFDTFSPLGPCLTLKDEIPNPNSLRLSTSINGEVLQDWTTSDMIFDVPHLIEFLSASTTLLPGTVILTGTPQGVGMARRPQRWLQPGDSVTVEIERIGKLTNPVELEK